MPSVLLSVSDKEGIVELARGLVSRGFTLVSTGGTARVLSAAGLPVTSVAEVTGFPEMLDGRVKTLHPAIHGGILYRRGLGRDEEDRHKHGIVSIDLVVVNLYPFEKTVASGAVTDDDAIEQIDIGGPSLIRAGCKNHAFITVATDSSQYSRILEQVQSRGCTTPELRRELAQAAFERTAAYDRVIADYFASPGEENGLLRSRLHVDLRRGEVNGCGQCD
jgi:phosphoribosylaminoimidazolecarboxamide formyltransferase/IMP cyclohydrolase